MSTSTFNEGQIQSEIDRLKTQFPQTRDIYRETCALLFFRYGITPTANKLYQYVRKGSMSAPAEALNKFWLELRDKSRIRLEHPDIPQEMRETAGNFIGELWSRAQASAKDNFTAQMTDAEDKVAQAQQELEVEHEQREKLGTELDLTRSELKTALQTISEGEIKHASDISTLAHLEKSLKTLQNEREQFERSLESMRQGFSRDLDKVNEALTKAEERYRALETRALLEVDRERQQVRKLEKELAASGESLRKQQQQHLKELTAMQKLNASLREKLGAFTGQLTQLKRQHDELMKKLGRTEKALTNHQAKLMQRPARNRMGS